MIQTEYAGLVAACLFFTILLGAFMKFLRAKNIKDLGIRPQIAVANMFFIILVLFLFLFLLMVIIQNYMLL